jgi:hypothetical protein
MGWSWAFSRCRRPLTGRLRSTVRRWKKRWPDKSVNILAVAEDVSTWCD